MAWAAMRSFPLTFSPSPPRPQVGEGVECGLGCDDFLDWAEGDKLDVYLLVSKARRLEEAKATTAVDVASLTA